MIRYDVRFTGPSDPQWYADRGLDMSKELWAGGKVVVLKNFAPVAEYEIDIMSLESWNKFCEYVVELDTQSILPKEEIIKRFEKKTGHSIEWADK